MTTISFQQRELLIGDSQMENVLSLARKAAGSKATVLICGESGTGKELIARYIHEVSPRKEHPFLSINCAAIPEGLIEAELFGYEKGAFTGAVSQRIGIFERANEGSLLLDEVTEMPMPLQAKFLRVIQEGEIDRLGGGKSIPFNTRLIATSNREPKKLVTSGQFREDLFYRLNVLRIDCPPLRQREEAIRNLSEFFVHTNAEKYGKSGVSLSKAALGLLVTHHWPGNVRELANVLERAVLLNEVGEIKGDEIKQLLSSRDPESSSRESQRSLALVEQEHIEDVLMSSRGNRTEAAKLLGISVRTLRNKLKQYSMAS